MSNEAIIETKYGTVRGTDLGAVSVWKGLPYAQPPVGARRFQAPLPLEAWSEVRDATHFGPIAPQDLEHLGNLTGSIGAASTASANPEISSEDCLYLNIWSPHADEKKRPVLVWIHGGAFIIGSGSQPDYDGASFAKQGDVVVVTINYRLGVLGFLHLGELGDETYASAGNCGLLDQIAALKWIRENITAFGGDPNNITIFGESAGAMSVGTLLVMPAAQGLFQRAILESGASTNVQTSEGATKLAREFLDSLAITPDKLASLNDVPLKQLLAAQTQLLNKNPLGGIRPVIDGRDLPEAPMKAIAAGAARKVEMLIGTNRDEMKLFTAGNAESSTDSAMAQRMLGERTMEIFGTYASARPDAEMRAIGQDIVTDYVFRIPAIRLAETQAQHNARVWMYRFDWPSPNPKFGACHALEMPFVWNNLDRSLFRVLTGENAPQQLAHNMHAAWLAFARTGDPNTSDLPAWPAYESETRATMLFDTECRVANDPQGAERAVWGDLI